ncbi:MAG: hypothetical protein WAO35_21660 [Terriglobia bacterium]
MKSCPYCNYSNYDNATVCRKCDASFVAPEHGTVDRPSGYWMGPQRAKTIRSRALAMIVLGLLIRVYWGDFGPWQPVDFPILLTLRSFLQPILLYGGAALYIFGWIVRRI